MSEYKVLIIDDDIWMQRILSKTLESYGFKTTLLASDGFEGVAKAVEEKPNLIILDILMPDLSGHHTLKLLKKIKITKDIPVLMVSALSDVENLSKAVKIGTAGFISKPFTRSTVYEKLVDVFGKERLSMIRQGESIEGMDDFEPQNILETESDSSLSDDIEGEDRQAGDDDEKSSEKQREKLLQFYQDDEKKSIESIKKLLLKKK